MGCPRRRGARSSPAYVHWGYRATILVHSTSLGCTLPIVLIAVGTALAAGPVGSLALFAAYRLGLGLVLTAVALGAALVRGVVSTTLRRALPYVQQVSALLLVVAGGYLLWTDLLHLLS